MLKWHWKTCTPGDLCQSIFLHSRPPILQSSNQTWFLGHAGWAEIRWFVTVQLTSTLRGFVWCFRLSTAIATTLISAKGTSFPFHQIPSWILHGINSSNFTEPKFLFFLVLATKQNLKSKLGRCLQSCLQREILVGSLPWSLVLGPWGLMSQAARWDAESISWCMEKCRCIDEIWRGTRCLVATPRGKCIFSYQLHSCHSTLTCWFLAHLESQQIRQRSSRFDSLFQESNMIAMGWMILEVFTARFFAADLSIFILSLWFHVF